MRREKIKKSQSVGDDLNHFRASKQYNQRRVTSGALYEHRYQFGDAGLLNTCPDDVIGFSVHDPNGNNIPYVVDKRTDHASTNTNGCPRSYVYKPQRNLIHFPDVVNNKSKMNGARCVPTADKMITSYPPFGTLRRQFTEPDLSSTLFQKVDTTNKHERPSSAHALPSLPSTPFLVDHNGSPTRRLSSPLVNSGGLQDSERLAQWCLGFEEHNNTEFNLNNLDIVESSKRVPQVTKAHFQATSRITPCKDVPKQSNFSRRRSLEPDMMRRDLGETEDHFPQREKVRHVIEGNRRLTPRSYFLKYGVPLDKVQLLEILLEERESLQLRIREFLARQNP